MSLRALIILLHIGIVLGNGQIYFPSDADDGNYYAIANAYKRTTQTNIQQNINHNLEYLVSRSLLKITLDINRAVQTTSGQISTSSNFAFGPVTITGVLALVLLASVGQTFNEIANFMGFTYGFNIENDNLEVHRQLGILSQKVVRHSSLTDLVSYKIAIFVQDDYPVRYEFKRAVDYYYQADIINLNFKSYSDMSYNYINSWVVNATNGRINHLLDGVPPPSTKAIIAGVLYFKGVWENPFIPGGSTWTPFYINGRKNPSDRKVLMMYNGAEFPYYKDKQHNVEILGLPYKGRATTMYIILPFDSNLERLRQLENHLTPDDIERFVNSTRPTEVALGFPKMKIVNSINLLKTMQHLGVNTLFNSRKANLGLLTDGVKKGFALFPPRSAPPPTRTTTTTQSNLNHELIFARFSDQSDCETVYDFSRRATGCPDKQPSTTSEDFLETLRREYQKYKLNPSQGNPGLYVDQFIHKVFIDVDEVGTEAAATSGIGISRSGKVTFKCDVPFLFFIYQEDTKMLLFWGSIKSPDPNIPNYN